MHDDNYGDGRRALADSPEDWLKPRRSNAAFEQPIIARTMKKSVGECRVIGGDRFGSAEFQRYSAIVQMRRRTSSDQLESLVIKLKHAVGITLVGPALDESHRH